MLPSTGAFRALGEVGLIASLSSCSGTEIIEALCWFAGKQPTQHSTVRKIKSGFETLRILCGATSDSWDTRTGIIRGSGRLSKLFGGRGEKSSQLGGIFF